MTTQIDHALIEQVVWNFYRYVTFSHTWEGNEPLYDEVVKIAVHDLEASPTHNKLQMFCKVVRDEGFHWAWSDTCCINKVDYFVLQEALVCMFKWYEGSAMTIIFLFDVGQLAEIGALMMSKWNSRGWTLQEYHASKVVRIYTKDWTLYRGLAIYNYKESPEIISEMEKATGISARALMALRPGLNDIREKLRLASMRQTTRVEDAAYSLLGIFSMSLPVTYGDGDRALGQLLSQLLTSSGDTSILAWTGKPGSFNSCLPTSIIVFNQPLTSYIPPAIADAEMEIITARLRASSLDVNLATRLYDRVDELPTPTFAGQRMRLPCLAFKLRLVSGRQDGSEYVFGAQAGAIGAVEVKTKQNLTRLGFLYLVHPWIGFLLDRQVARSTVEVIAEEDTPSRLGSFSFPYLSGPSYPVGSESPSTSPAMDAQTHVSEFLARLRQPFGALLLASNPRNTAEYKRVAAGNLITVQAEEITSATLDGLIHSVRVLDVL